MSEAKHTPGPWVAGRADMSTLVDGVQSKWVYGGEQSEQYVAVASGLIKGPWDEVMANARLIAAAPDLLAASQALLDALAEPIEIVREHHMDNVVQAMADAIAKATTP